MIELEYIYFLEKGNSMSKIIFIHNLCEGCRRQIDQERVCVDDDNAEDHQYIANGFHNSSCEKLAEQNKEMETQEEK